MDTMTILQLLIAFAVPVLLSLAITPLVIRLATKIGAIDQPNERKIHSTPIPRLGGVAIYISFFLTLLILFLLNPAFHFFDQLEAQKEIMLGASLLLVLLLGIWDDVHSLNPRQKFIVQLLAFNIVYFAGFRVSSITSPFGEGIIELGIFDYPITLLWIVGVTNAFNLIDGLDGLASGVAMIASLTIFSISLIKGDMNMAIMILILAGAVLGFLRYNFNPARIFLGDSGSLFLGFSLAVLSMQSSTKGSAAVAIIVPVLALGFPIMDTLLSMARRFLRSLLPSQGKSVTFLRKLDQIFLPDRGHIHHQLIARGLSHRSVVLVLYFVSCAFGIGAFFVTISNNLVASLILVAVGVATYVGIRQLRYKEMAVLRNGVLLPLYEWPLMNHRLFQGFLDLVFIVVSFSLAEYLGSGLRFSGLFSREFLSILGIISGISLVVLYFSGLYKGSFRHLGVGDVLTMLKAVALSVIVSGIVLMLFPASYGTTSLTTLLLNFYFLLSFVVGARISYHVLNYLFRREQNGDKRVLIYGADVNGILTLQQLINDHTLNLSPVGFIDDTPHLEGKHLNGYPIFGGHWKLQRLISTLNIDEIVLSGDAIKPEILNRIKQLARLHRITIRKFLVHLEDVSLETKKAQPVEQTLVYAPK